MEKIRGEGLLNDTWEARGMRLFTGFLAIVGVLALFGCSEEPPINQVGVNVVEKSIFTDSWYMSRTVVDVDYEAAGLGTFPGDAASDFAGGGFTAMPRIRWVIDEGFLYAYRDYELITGADGEPEEPGEDLGQPVAAFTIESHFDIKRLYNSVTGEEMNVIGENASDRRWYDRRFMRVDWSKNLLPGYYGQIHNLYEVLGYYRREPTDLYVQSFTEFPESWRPQFHYMTCDGPDDTSSACKDTDRAWADDYERGELYHMSFVNQELLSPGNVPDPLTGQPINWCASIYSDAPTCTAYAVFTRTSFLKVSDEHQYVAENWLDSRFDRSGFFRIEQPTYDRSTSAEDPAFFETDFLNYNINRHNIWRRWYTEDADGVRTPIPYAEREIRQVLWYATHELPAHLVKPSMDLVAAWNVTLMSTVRNLRGQEDAFYPRVACQVTSPDDYCFCTTDPGTGDTLLPDTDGDGIGDCAGRYDTFTTPEDATAAGASNPYDCYVEIPEGAEPNLEDDAVSARLSDEDFYGWYGARFVGSECINVLKMNTCHRAAVAENGGTTEGLECEERGDMRFKFLSYVDQPGTRFLGIATMRTDPVTGEIIVGDANIGGPALDGYRTFALEQFDVLNGNLTEQELLTGEDVRSYLENVNRVQLPAPPRVDFNVGLAAGIDLDDGRGEIDRIMGNAMHRIEQLQGPEGRANVFSDRRYSLAGTDIERRMTHNVETLMMAGIRRLPEGVGPDQIGDIILDKVSPFRTNANDLLADFAAIEEKTTRANMMMPNEYIDDSVMHYVERHRDWTRARLHFELNRHLFYETQLHEMGHCMGMRHQFDGSADRYNYFDDYYHIDEAFPLPSPLDYDTDGTPGLGTDEQQAYEDAYNGIRSRRELAGIDRWMNTSVMEYTANWYERTVSQAGRYDYAAMAFAYGDVVEIYDNAAGTNLADIDPTNTPRTGIHYYHGGESCSTDADCPYNTGGSQAELLMGTNRDSGLVQTCMPHPRGGALGNVCSSYDQDAAAMVAGDPAPRYVPVNYMFCSDERATGGGTAPGTEGICNRFDEGDSYREIVRNIAESYERMYLWTNFRRYNSGFDIGNYLFNTLIGRRLVILQNVYQNMVFRYVSDPEWRTSTGPFGFYDQFMATADILNFYGRILAQPNIGTYRWNESWERYQRSDVDPDRPGGQLSIPLGLGRYFSSVYQSGLSGINRVERIGTFYDKLFVMQLLAVRGWQSGYTPDISFVTNYYDIFPLEVQQMFSGMIRDEPEAISARIECGEGTFPTCIEPRLIYMDFYRGDCSAGSTTCRPDPQQVTYRDLPVLDGGSAFLLQFYAAIYGLSEFPVYFDTTFANQLFVCVEGQGDCFAPASDAVEGVDYVRYDSERYGKSFLAYQVEPTAAVANQTSIGFDMVREARDLSFILRMIQTFRGDFGGTPLDSGNLTAAELARLAALDYDLPGDSATVNSEENRIDGRLRDVESFFFQLIQLQNQYFSF